MSAGWRQAVDHHEQSYRLRKGALSCTGEAAVVYHEQSGRLENGVYDYIEVDRVSCFYDRLVPVFVAMP